MKTTKTLTALIAVLLFTFIGLSSISAAQNWDWTWNRADTNYTDTNNDGVADGQEDDDNDGIMNKDDDDYDGDNVNMRDDDNDWTSNKDDWGASWSISPINLNWNW